MITSRRARAHGRENGGADFRLPGFTGLSELDAEWARRVEEAEARARTAGRDVADYLTLRASNDAARSVGCAWLVETFQRIAGEANRAGSSLAVALEDAHRFGVGNSWMVGRRLTLRAGVRAVTVEAGWPRSPRDGVVRGGGLARARVSHFGDRAAGEELLLVRDRDGTPRWLAVEGDAARSPKSGSDFDESRARAHVSRLLG
jgi:hypothetical protein